MKTRKRSWRAEEVILALDLYLREGMANPTQRRALSEFLRAWPEESHFAADETFRNAQAVRNKLDNLRYLDTDGQHGREKGGAATEAVWREFDRDADRVATAAREVRAAFDAAREGVGPEITYEADESGLVMRLHRRRERDQGLVRRKRDAALDATGALACEACGFDSQALYGIFGVIDCHHVRPVSELEPGERTRLEDLRLVCPTCHRLIHARRPWLSWDALVALVRPMRS
jgi:5-methylcytosine-specific restriction protein A